MVLEGTSDVRVVRGFAERALLEQDSDFDANLFSWRGLDDNTEFVQWLNVSKMMLERKISRRYGHFEGEISGDAGKIYAHQARNALRLCHAIGLPLAVILVCDADSQPQRLEGLEQARKDHQIFAEPDYPIVVGIADPCREAWVLCGFEVQGHEQKKLIDLTRELNFDPTRAPHKLTTAERPHNAKRVLKLLTDKIDLEREELCWKETRYQWFLDYGTECGLKAYLEEVQEHLPVLLGKQKGNLNV